MPDIERGYTLFDTPLDKYATREELVRIYEFVRVNIDRIVPFLPTAVEIDLIASETAHSNGLVPLLGFHFGANIEIKNCNLNSSKMNSLAKARSSQSFTTQGLASFAPLREVLFEKLGCIPKQAS